MLIAPCKYLITRPYYRCRTGTMFRVHQPECADCRVHRLRAEMTPHARRTPHSKEVKPVGKFRLINFSGGRKPACLSVGPDAGQKWTVAMNRARFERCIFITVCVNCGAAAAVPARPDGRRVRRITSSIGLKCADRPQTAGRTAGTLHRAGCSGRGAPGAEMYRQQAEPSLSNTELATGEILVLVDTELRNAALFKKNFR